MNVKHVLCFIASLSGGGAERQMVELMKILLERRYNVTLLTYTHSDNYECPVGVNRISVFAKNKVELLFKLIKTIKSLKFDCCISYLPQNNFIACLSTFPFKKFKLIVGERNLTTKLGQFEHLMYYLYRRADYIVSNSVSQSNFIKEVMPFLSPKVRIITNYTDVEKNHPLSLCGKNKCKINVGVFARYIAQKNPLFLVDVVWKLKQQGYSNFVFYWYGNYCLNLNNTEQMSPLYLEMKKKIFEYGIEKQLILNSFSENVVRDMNEMDIICLPSLYEGYPNVISEGMACGRFIIASRVSDIPLIVEDEVNGFLFNPTDIESAVSAFVKYQNLSGDEIQKVCLANRMKAEKIFTKNIFAEKYIQLIEY